MKMSFESLAKDTKFMDYQNAQIILVGAREGRDAIKNEIDIEIEESSQSADIFNKLSGKIPSFNKTIDGRKIRV
jgi:hypothetical protein